MNAKPLGPSYRKRISHPFSVFYLALTRLCDFAIPESPCKLFAPSATVFRLSPFISQDFIRNSGVQVIEWLFYNFSLLCTGLLPNRRPKLRWKWFSTLSLNGFYFYVYIFVTKTLNKTTFTSGKNNIECW